MVEFSANNASDPGDYYIGEKIAKDGTYLRRMDNPSLDGGSANCWSSGVGGLDVHYSSGVGNHLFYLLVRGHRHQDHRWPHAHQHRLQRHHADRHRPRRRREDLVPRR